MQYHEKGGENITEKTENKKDDSSTRLITKGFFGGLEFGFLFYLATLFLRIGINMTAGQIIVPLNIEVGAFAIGFSGGIVKNL